MNEHVDIYVVAGITYWGHLPQPRIEYAGTDLNKVKEQIREILLDTAYFDGELECIPEGYEDKVTLKTTIDEFVEILLNELIDENKIMIDTDFVRDYDEPFCYTITHW